MKALYVIAVIIILATGAGAGSAPCRGTAIIGKATYYTRSSCRSEGTSGFLTASGRSYDECALTCALPLSVARAWNMSWGQSVRVVNLANGRSLVVTYTDRGPGKGSRRAGTVIDLTPAAFVALGGKLKDGKIRVRVERE